MTQHAFNFAATPKAVNGLELFEQLRVADAVANVAITRNESLLAVDIVVTTSNATPRATFESIISAHVPSKTDAETAEELEAARFLEDLTERLEVDESFRVEVKGVIETIEGK